ncbi:hypothetical protein IQ276_008375 [Desmonostoc muscorum LEGE 12446]|uniref:Uncharacterized protein n=1 Tax=Desmonostoc muscorum LEGE 12446 TaxID=1828758 RepID=A0A8J6ZJG2_DESMC|nr:hypothetical protein [Desmonostoc muscorum]MCF2146465.1 hypothetical protein [Desmonostoc muscorum LEGE 12446]
MSPYSQCDRFLDYSTEEWKALGEMGIKDANEFIAILWQELESLNL